MSCQAAPGLLNWEAHFAWQRCRLGALVYSACEVREGFEKDHWALFRVSDLKLWYGAWEFSYKFTGEAGTTGSHSLRISRLWRTFNSDALGRAIIETWEIFKAYLC